MEKKIGVFLVAVLLCAFAGCKKSGADGESLDDKIKKSQTITANAESETGETLEENLKNWRGEPPKKEDSYTEVVPSTDYEVISDRPYSKALQTLQGTLRSLGQRLNQYYALYRIYPAGEGEAVWDAIKTKNPSNDDVSYEMYCWNEDACTLTATLKKTGKIVFEEDKQKDGFWPQLMYFVEGGTPAKEGVVRIYQYLSNEDDLKNPIDLDDFTRHESNCDALGGEMTKFGCVVKEKLGSKAKKDKCSELGGVIKEGECVLKEEIFR